MLNIYFHYWPILRMRLGGVTFFSLFNPVLKPLKMAFTINILIFYSGLCTQGYSYMIIIFKTSSLVSSVGYVKLPSFDELASFSCMYKFSSPGADCPFPMPLSAELDTFPALTFSGTVGIWAEVFWSGVLSGVGSSADDRLRLGEHFALLCFPICFKMNDIVEKSKLHW